jgi:hypothetical protein
MKESLFQFSSISHFITRDEYNVRESQGRRRKTHEKKTEKLIIKLLLFLLYITNDFSCLDCMRNQLYIC